MDSRPTKRLRRLSTDDGDSEGTDDWETQAMSMSGRAQPQQQDNMPRTRRGASNEPQKRSIRLTVKAPPSRLQEIKGDEDEEDARPSRGRSGRASRQKQSYVEKPTSEEEDDDEEDQEGANEDEDDEEQDAEGEEDEDEDEEEEDEDEDADGDVDMDDIPPPKPTLNKPTIKISTSGSAKAGRGRKQSPSTHLNLSNTKHRSVEEKETADAASQSESSEVEDDPEDLENGALDEPDERMDSRGDTIKVDAINESDLDSDDSNESSLPDLSKLTRRQRGGVDEGSLMALSNEAQKKKFFTPEQITMRRAEMARRRKDLSEKRNEQEKADTLRRLLQKPAPTRRSRAQVLADAEREEFGLGRAGLRGESVAGDEEEGEMVEKANRIYARTVMSASGTRVAVPSEWLDAPAGKLFDDATSKPQGWPDQVNRPGRMVEEVS